MLSTLEIIRWEPMRRKRPMEFQRIVWNSIPAEVWPVTHVTGCKQTWLRNVDLRNHNPFGYQIPVVINSSANLIGTQFWKLLWLSFLSLVVVLIIYHFHILWAAVGNDKERKGASGVLLDTELYCVWKSLLTSISWWIYCSTDLKDFGIGKVANYKVLDRIWERHTVGSSFPFGAPENIYVENWLD